MITEKGPTVIEYNCRFGDPETQVVIPLIDGDFAQLLMSAAEGGLDVRAVEQHPASAVCVVMASLGYPDEYETGKDIRGLESFKPEEGIVVFHAGTRLDGEKILTSGGRVLGVTAVGYDYDLKGTIDAAYRAVGKITFDGAYYRSDIGQKALRRRTESEH
jgi:phosphoribosylamine--glycine ligase